MFVVAKKTAEVDAVGAAGDSTWRYLWGWGELRSLLVSDKAAVCITNPKLQYHGVIPPQRACTP